MRCSIAVFKNKRLFVLLFAFALALALACCSVFAESADGEDPFSEADEEENEADFDEILESLIGSIELDGWDSYLNELRGGEEQGYSGAEEMIADLARSGYDEEPEPIWLALVNILFPAFKQQLSKLTVVLAIAAVSMLCGIVFKGDGMEKPVILVLSFASVLSIAAAFSSLAALARDACSKAASFSEICAPALAIVLSICGNAQTGAVLAPKLPLLAGGITALIGGIVMPLLLAAGIMSVLSGVTELFRLNGFVKLIHRAVKWMLALASTVYSAVILLSGIGAAGADGAAMKGARFAIDRLVPSGGSIITGSIDAAASGAVLVKNAVGTASILIFIGAILVPALTVASGMFAFRTVSAVCESFGEQRLGAILSGVSDTLSYMFACCACCAALFAFTVAAMLVAGSLFV